MGLYSTEEDFRSSLDQLPENLVRQPVDRIQLFLNTVCDTETALYQKHGMRNPVEIPQKNTKIATGLSDSPFQSALRLLDHDALGPVRVTKNQPIVVLRPTAAELGELMEIRLLLETEASVQLHRDSVAQSEWKTRIMAKHEALEVHRQHLEQLGPQPANGPSNGEQIAHWVASEYYWREDTALHTDVFLATGRTYAATIVRLLRDKMRLVSSRRYVVCGRTADAEAEHQRWLEAVFAPYAGPESEARVAEEIRRHLEAALAHLKAVMKEF